MYATNNPAAVVDAHRRRLRWWLIAALVALAVTASSLVALSRTAAPACLAAGPGPVGNGKAIIAAGVALHMPQDGIVAGLTAAMQETGMRNLANPDVPESLTVAHDGLSTDHNTLGVLAQTPSWGSVEELMSPPAAAAKFFTTLRQDWHRGPYDASTTPDELAAFVQRSAVPGAYTAQVPAAEQFYRDHIDEVRAAPCLAGEIVGTEAIS